MIRLFGRYWTVPAMVSVAVESVVLFACFELANRIRYLQHDGMGPTGGGLLLASAVFAGVALLSLYVHGLYDFSERLTVRQLTIALLRALTTATVGLLTLYFLFPRISTIRGVLAIALLLSWVALGLWRLLLRRAMNLDSFAERVLIVGSGPIAVDLARELLSRRHLGYRVVGFLEDDPALQGISLVNPRVIGYTDQARELAVQNGVSRVVVAKHDRRGGLSMDALLECKTSGVRVQEASAFYEQLTGKIMVEGLRKSWLIFSDGFVVSRFALFLKRLLDIAVSLTLLVLTAPLMAVVALAVRLDSPGPVLFRQERVGRRGEPFVLSKFRSMRTDAEKDGARWAVVGDPRVTRVGRFIRATRLDELPQLWNVLVGDMSFVGPRPERAEFVRQLVEVCPYYSQRLVVRPGLTGWAQIKAPYASSFEESIEKLKFDLYYIKNLSLFLDLTIILSTVRTVLLRRGSR